MHILDTTALRRLCVTRQRPDAVATSLWRPIPPWLNTLWRKCRQHTCAALILLGLLGLPTPLSAMLTSAVAEAPGGVRQEISMDAKAQNFALLDQYDKTHTLHFPQPTVSVLVFADYAGSAQLEDWIRPIYDRYQRAIGIHGIAELSAVPQFIRGLVRSAIQKRVQYPVMLDWHGTVSKSYDYQSGAANLLVVDALGRILLKVTGAVDATKFHQVTTLIDRLLSQ